MTFDEAMNAVKESVKDITQEDFDLLEVCQDSQNKYIRFLRCFSDLAKTPAIADNSEDKFDKLKEEVMKRFVEGDILEIKNIDQSIDDLKLMKQILESKQGLGETVSTIGELNKIKEGSLSH